MLFCLLREYYIVEVALYTQLSQSRQILYSASVFVKTQESSHNVIILPVEAKIYLSKMIELDYNYKHMMIHMSRINFIFPLFGFSIL